MKVRVLIYRNGHLAMPRDPETGLLEVAKFLYDHAATHSWRVSANISHGDDTWDELDIEDPKIAAEVQRRWGG